jgi:hypothetical protein
METLILFANSKPLLIKIGPEANRSYPASAFDFQGREQDEDAHRPRYRFRRFSPFFSAVFRGSAHKR